METNGPTDEQKRRSETAEYRRVYWQQYYLKNKERVLQRCRERSKAWYARNKEQYSLDHKVYYQQNADQKRAERMERYWNVEKPRGKKFTPTLVGYKLNVTLAFD
jgi:hypothetical protein